MAELFLIGQIVGARSFPVDSLFCKWKLIIGPGWKILEGVPEGQTQVDCSCNQRFACWSHPIDIHLVTKGIQGWPKLVLEVWHKNRLDQSALVGYGVVNVPSQPGNAKIVCHTWRPLGSLADRLATLFSGETLHLTEEWLVYSSEHRFNLHTENMGTIHLELDLILKDFEKFGIETH